MTGDDSLQRLTGEVATALMPLEWALGSPEALRHLLRESLGYDVPEALTGLGIDPQTVQALLDAFDGLCDELVREPPDEGAPGAAWAALAAAVSAATAAVLTGPAALAGQIDPDFLAASRLVETLPRRLLDWLVYERLRVSSPVLLGLMELFGLAETLTVAADPATFTTAHRRRVLRYDRAGRVLGDPPGLLREVYGWGTPGARLDALLARLASVATVMGGRYQLLLPAAELRAALHDPAAEDVPPAVMRPPQLRVPLVREGDVEAGLSLVILPPQGAGGAPGLALVPFAGAGLTTDVPVDSSGRWTLSFKGSLDATGLAGVIARPGQPLRGLFGAAGGGEPASGRLTLELRRRDPAGDPTTVAALGRALELTAAELAVCAGLAAGTGADEVFIELGVRGGELGLDLAGADGFLRQVLPASLRAQFELAFGVSSRRGAYLAGGAGLEVTRPLNVSAGAVSLTGLTVALAPGAGQVELLVGLAAAVRLGPVTVSVDRVGARLRASAPDAGGNLGPIDLAVDFKAPAGLGLAIEAGLATGSGYLFFDAAREQYAGALHLDFEGIALGAVGLLTTRLPDGSDGYSLIVLVTASGFAPVPLGYGFTLTGVGGLVGVNRTIAVDVLRSGLRQGTLGPVLFSRDDPVPRAPQIVGALQALFPPAPGRYLVGPAATIEWGTPTVLTIELAVALELPSPLRLVILGRLSALLPPSGERAALVKLRMDALGLVELDRREASLDASLVDSSIAGFPISGDVALRMGWGEQPAFALAAGGFHPRFAPPPGFPSLRRLTIPLSTGDSPRLRLEAYLALTSNTVQVGARLDLYVEAAGFALAGMLSFDALVQFAPFWLELDVAGAVALKRGSSVLMSVEVRLHLTGPAPWHARGEATFRIFVLKVGVAFEATFGEAAPVELPPPVAVWPLLRAALEDARSWEVGLPAGGAALVTLRPAPADGAEILAHPLGRIAVRQRVVPLERDVSRFANAPPADFRRFAIEHVTVGARLRDHVPTYDSFAPAQFAEMSEDERLRAPGFDRMPAGAAVAGEDAVAGPEQAITPEFRTIVLGGTAPAAAYVPSADTVVRLAETGAAGLARSRRRGRARYAVEGAAPVRLRDPEFVPASRDTLGRPDGMPAADGSYSGAREAVAAYERTRPGRAGTAQVARREEMLA